MHSLCVLHVWSARGQASRVSNHDKRRGDWSLLQNCFWGPPPHHNQEFPGPLSRTVKRPESEADHAPPSIAFYAFMAFMMDNLAFYVTRPHVCKFCDATWACPSYMSVWMPHQILPSREFARNKVTLWKGFLNTGNNASNFKKNEENFTVYIYVAPLNLL